MSQTLLHTVGIVLAFVRHDEVVHFVLGEALGIGLPYAVQRWDRGRLTPAQRERAWNGASWGSALYGFGQLSMIGWLWVTRQEARRWWRESRPLAVARSGLVLLVGAVAAGVVTGVMIALAAGAAALLDAIVPLLLEAPGRG